MEQIRNLIFDMDDTLVNTVPLHKKSFADTFLKYGIDLEKEIPKEKEKDYFGKTHVQIAELLIKKFNLNITAEKFLEERENQILEMLKKSEPMPGFKELVEFLKNYKGKKAIATASTKAYADIVLETHNLKELFDVITTSDEITNSKPDPEIFLLTSEKLGVAPETCIVIEDSKSGVEGAKSAGMKAMGIKNSVFETFQDLSHADIVLDNLSEVEEAVKKLE